MKSCSKCGKSSKKAANRSHAKNKTLRRQHANIQKINGKSICTKCIRTMAKQVA